MYKLRKLIVLPVVKGIIMCCYMIFEVYVDTIIKTCKTFVLQLESCCLHITSGCTVETSTSALDGKGRKSVSDHVFFNDTCLSIYLEWKLPP